MAKATPKSSKSKARAPSPTPSASSSSSSEAMSVDSDDIDSTPAPTSSSKQRKSKPGERLYYEPPPGMEPVRINVNYDSVFEWDRLDKGDCELWAIRMPVDLKPSHLAGLSTRVSGDRVTGSLAHKERSFALQESEETSDLSSLNLLVPRKSGGHLFRAPRPIKRHLLLVPEEGVVPSSRKKLEAENRATGPIPNVPRTLPPSMKFRNPVNGFDTPGPAPRTGGQGQSLSAAPEKAEVAETPRKSKKAKLADTKEDEKEDRKVRTPKEKGEKKKKRKSEGADTPKKKK